MSNVDRYRPTRESYQPPSLSIKPSVHHAPAAASLSVDRDRERDRASNSPASVVRRREVPPAVPSPPTQTSRTSPPRPNSRRSAPSSDRGHNYENNNSDTSRRNSSSRTHISHANAASTSSPAQSGQQEQQRLKRRHPGNQWVFTPDEVVSSQSIVDGLSIAEERLRRAKGVNFIYQAGIILELPMMTLWAAGVFFHRFYMRVGMVEEKGGIHHYNIAATALFLANKTEENCRKTKDLIVAIAKVAQKNHQLLIDEQSKEYWRWRDSILHYEELMLEMLTFDIMVDNPYNKLYHQLVQVGVSRNKQLRDSAWAFCNDACLTVIPLLLDPRDIALSGIFWASIIRHVKIADVNGKAWWRFFEGSEEMIRKGMDVMVEFYKENPLKNRDMSNFGPGSPEFILENTRIRSNAHNNGSQNGTPMATIERDHPSPKPAHGNSQPELEDERIETFVITKEGSEHGEKQAAPEMKIEEAGETNGLVAAAKLGNGDSDIVLKAAANDLDSHEGRPKSETEHLSPGGTKRKTPDIAESPSSNERHAKRPKTAQEEVAD